MARNSGVRWAVGSISLSDQMCEIHEFGLERGDFGGELFDQGLGPALEWQISFFERVAVRIGDEDVIIEVRREIRHGAT